MATTRKNYHYAVGRRKSASARVRYTKKGEGKIIVNEKDYTEYFPTKELQRIVFSPIDKSNHQLANDITVKVVGGGSKGQAEAVAHGIARVLLLINEDLRAPLKKAGLLTRDARIKERKKPGLKKARRAPQWSKR